MGDEAPEVRHKRDRPAVMVQSLGAQRMELLAQSEAEFYEAARDKYLDEYTFTQANDLRALDRLLLMEVQMHRYQTFVLSGKDYDADPLDAKDEIDLHRRMKELSAQIEDLQKSLGLTKAQRDANTHDTVGGYITLVQQAAKAHGVNREKQLGKALELTKELFSLVESFERSNEEERRKLGFEGPADILQWIREFMKPEFDAIDAHFREHEAKFYRRQL